MNTLSIIISIICAVLFLVSIKSAMNVSYLFISCFTLSSIITSGNEKYYLSVGRYINYDTPKYECTIIVPDTMDDIQALSLIEPDKYTIFKYVDRFGKIVKVQSQKDIINKLTK